MDGTLAWLCVALFVVITPGLLVARFLSQKWMSWWRVAATVALSSWALLYLSDVLAHRAAERCQVPMTVSGETCIGYLVDYAASYNSQLGWLKGLAYLMLCLPIYGFAQWLRRRRGSPRVAV
jgi:hypothetical protein